MKKTTLIALAAALALVATAAVAATQTGRTGTKWLIQNIPCDGTQGWANPSYVVDYGQPQSIIGSSLLVLVDPNVMQYIKGWTVTLAHDHVQANAQYVINALLGKTQWSMKTIQPDAFTLPAGAPFALEYSCHANQMPNGQWPTISIATSIFWCGSC